jgi:hypothetical protein
LWFQKDSALGRWYRERTAAAPGARKTLIVALARKLLIALWRLVHDRRCARRTKGCHVERRHRMVSGSPPSLGQNE